MNRRRFLTILGLAPVVAKVAPVIKLFSDPSSALDWTKGIRYGYPFKSKMDVDKKFKISPILPNPPEAWRFMTDDEMAKSGFSIRMNYSSWKGPIIFYN